MNIEAEADKWMRNEIIRFLIGIVGVAIYCFGVNFFMVPLGLYSGGFLGISQLLRTFLVSGLGINFGNFDIAGLFYYLFNIPLIILAYKIMPKTFVIKVFIVSTTMSLFLSLFGAPKEPLLEESLANCIIGAIICGFGVGTYLKCGCSSGGTEIIGIYLIRKNYNLSIGQVNLTVNAFIYLMCLLVFNVQTAVYSIIFSVVSTLVMDKIHTQTINVEAIIISKKNNDLIEKKIMEEMQRGITYWEAYGGYTNEKSFVMYTIISKYEVPALKRIVHEANPQAFTVFKEGPHVSGNFIKRL